MRTLEEHVINAIRQQRESGETIGRRQTPVISFWPMRQKWEKFGFKPFEMFGTDGDAFVENGRFVIPAVLQLVYFRVKDRMCLLAYIEKGEHVCPGLLAEREPMMYYDFARQSKPQYIEPLLTTKETVTVA